MVTLHKIIVHWITWEEKVQHRASKMMMDLIDKTYKDRLRALHLMTLETWHKRRALIETFQIIKGLEDVDYSRLFSLSSGILRGHSMKLFKPRCHTNLFKNIFCNRVVDLWNDLDKDVINSTIADNFITYWITFFNIAD